MVRQPSGGGLSYEFVALGLVTDDKEVDFWVLSSYQGGSLDE